MKYQRYLEKWTVVIFTVFSGRALVSQLTKVVVLGRFRIADPVARHAKWVSCEALGVLLPRMQQSAKELLAELSAERARLGASPAAAAADVMPLKTIAPPTQSCSARIEDAQHTTRREYARPAAAEGGSLGEASRSGDSHEESQISRVPCERAREVEDQLRAPCSDAHVPRHVGEVRGTQVSATATARFEVAEEQTDDRQLASLRRECETSRIVVHALREKDEESQVRAGREDIVAGPFTTAIVPDLSDVRLTKRYCG